MKSTSILCAVCVLGLGCGGGGDSEPDARPGFDAANRTEYVYILKQVTLPATQADVDASKIEFPGSGVPVNKLGAMLQVLVDLLEGIPVQEDLDANFLAGEALQVFMARSATLDGVDNGVTGHYAQVADVDDPADPSNNWDGSGQFKLRAGAEFIQTIDEGTIDGGDYTGVGNDEISFSVLLPLWAGEDPIGSEGTYPQIRATIDGDTMSGAIANAVTPEEFDASVLPLAARLLTQVLVEDKPRESDVDAMFDTNHDGEVTVEELRNSDTMATLGAPDVDLDGDTANDHLSQGILFEAVRCELVSE